VAHYSPLDHIVARIDFRETDSAYGVYDGMESQSSRSLPVIYQPFDGRNAAHFTDRGLILDYATVIGGSWEAHHERGKRILDFGPGDGWPSLMIAPFFDEIVGVDASLKRVETCRANAERLGVKNATFLHVPTGEKLPFANESFDGITTGSSIEQTPDVTATVQDFHRVLRPG
jgi:SAM-dependent methyltransferase